MITCPWCGTNYQAFQPNCQNCGGPLPIAAEETSPSAPGESLPIPPSAPRQISDRFVWRLLSADGGWIVALVLGLVGAIFGIVGIGLTIAIITALIGIIFLSLGFILFVTGGILFFWRYQKAQKVVSVLRDGEASEGQINEVQQNYSVRINGRSPWIIGYEYHVNGQSFGGKVTTLNDPGQRMQVGNPVRILYLASDPKWSSIYPHP